MINHLTKPMIRLKGGLILGDTLTMLVVVWIGRLSHVVNIWDLSGLLATAGPFLLGWFAVMPFMGLFQSHILINWAKLWPRLTLGWAFIGLPLSLILRSISLGRPAIQGIIPTFAAVMLITTTLAMLGWRRGYIWWSQSR